MTAENDPRTSSSIFDRQFRGIYLMDVAVTLLSFIVCARFFSPERALLLSFLFAGLAVVAHIKWRLRSAAWFWAVLAIFGAPLLLLILLVPLPDQFRAAAGFAPVVILLGMSLLGVIGAIERRLER